MGRTRKGFEGALYRNTGSYGSPTWNEIPRIGDVTITDEMEEVDTWTRADGDLKTFEPGGRIVAVEFSILDDNSDEDLIALYAAYSQRTPVEFLFVNGKVNHAGAKGGRVLCMVTKFGHPQPINGNQAREIMLKPCPGGTGVTTYTDSGTTTTSPSLFA